jgi:diguanylate cyclase (GGDEF)-like protein/PAS domain S-box-containing protein
VNGIVLNIRDVTEQQLADEVLRRSEERFRSLVQHSSDMLMVLDGAGNVAYISPAAEQLLAVGATRRLGKYVFEGVHPDDAAATRALLERSLSSPGSVQAGEYRMRGRDGEWRYIECRMRNLLDESSVRGIVVNSRDVTERRLAEESSRESEERFRSLVQNASDMVTVLDGDGRITYQSPSIERILGYAPSEVTQRRLTDFIHPEDEPRARAQLERLAESAQGTVRFELRWRHLNDSYRHIEAVCTNLLGDAGVGGIVINARDVTDRKALERQLTRRAFLDSLTNLPNRLLFMHRLDRALQRASDAPNSVGVLFLDLDRFKIVNDSLGHEIGDQLLIAVGHRLRRIVRPADTVARLGGDEFIVLIEGAQSVDEVIRVAERIIEELSTPIRLNRHEVAVAVSVGIAMGENDGSTSQDLLRNADIALYRAKEQGTGGYVVFDASMARQAVQRLALENELRRAVQRNEFSVQYLPEIDLSTNNLAGLEVLMRWNHPERGLVRPSEFIAVAEETGLIVPIGEWALHQGCAQVRDWRARWPEARAMFLAINLSAREFRRPDLVEYITSTLESYGLQPSALRLEISEAIMVAEPLSTLEKLRRLKQRGVMLAIDDFGSGYSSLSYLTRVSFDTLKIDRQFVSGPGGVTNNLSIVRAVTSLAHALGMNVTAEGVESREHLTRVRAAGCDHGQGFLFSDALDAAAVEAQLFTPLQT